jgi:nitrogen fixation-related uncharacterized protein
MRIPPDVLLLLAIAILGSAGALAAFVWAVRNGEMDHFDNEDLL